MKKSFEMRKLWIKKYVGQNICEKKSIITAMPTDMTELTISLLIIW